MLRTNQIHGIQWQCSHRSVAVRYRALLLHSARRRTASGVNKSLSLASSATEDVLSYIQIDNLTLII